jgi:hypothetical protein
LALAGVFYHWSRPEVSRIYLEKRSCQELDNYLEMLFLMPANGPAIKGVCVAERMKAGAEKTNQKIVPVPARMNEAWRGFWSHGTKFRAYTSVALQC